MIGFYGTANDVLVYIASQYLFRKNFKRGFFLGRFMLLWKQGDWVNYKGFILFGKEGDYVRGLKGQGLDR